MNLFVFVPFSDTIWDALIAMIMNRIEPFQNVKWKPKKPLKVYLHSESV
jgi:hypothetical protein